MPQYLIERNIPNAGKLPAADPRDHFPEVV